MHISIPRSLCSLSFCPILAYIHLALLMLHTACCVYAIISIYMFVEVVMCTVSHMFFLSNVTADNVSLVQFYLFFFSLFLCVFRFPLFIIFFSLLLFNCVKHLIFFLLRRAQNTISAVSFGSIEYRYVHFDLFFGYIQSNDTLNMCTMTIYAKQFNLKPTTTSK